MQPRIRSSEVAESLLMAGASATDDSSVSTAGMRDDDRSLSGESLSEWRSCDQGDSGDSGSPSTSPPFWDTDYDFDDRGE
jgi:hypothetical protein